MGNRLKNIFQPLTYPKLKCTICPNHEIWHLATPTLHLHPPTHKSPLHSLTQQSNTPNNPNIPIQQTHKVLHPSKCWKPTQPVPRHHHNPIMIYTMHMPPQHMRMHGLAKTRHMMYTRGPHRQAYSQPPKTYQKCIECTYYHDRFLNTTMGEKTNKYDPLIQTLQLWDGIHHSRGTRSLYTNKHSKPQKNSKYPLKNSKKTHETHTSNSHKNTSHSLS